MSGNRTPDYRDISALRAWLENGSVDDELLPIQSVLWRLNATPRLPRRAADRLTEQEGGPPHERYPDPTADEQAARTAGDEPQRCGLAAHGGACDEPMAEGADRCVFHLVEQVRRLQTYSQWASEQMDQLRDAHVGQRDGGAGDDTAVGIPDRLDVRAGDGSHLTLTRHQDGRVSLSVGQCPDRTVSVRLPAAETARIRAWLDNTGHATVFGVVLRDQTAADLGIGASGDDAYRSGPAGDIWPPADVPVEDRWGYAGEEDGEAFAAAQQAGDTAPDDARDNPAWQRLIATTNAQEVARLRSEVAALRDAGNALAVAAMKPHEAYWETGLPDVDALDDAARAADAWRDAAGPPSPTDGA